MVANRRISAEEGLGLYRECGFCELGRQAGEVTTQLHPGRVRTYVIERNINYTNICVCRCSFCAFSVSPKSDRGYVLSDEQIDDKITALWAMGGRQIMLQGGMNPQLPLEWYERMLGRLKERFTGLHIHAFSPPEIVFLAGQSDLSVRAVLERLKGAGLDSLPGGGAEILVERVRRIIAPAKCSAGEWLEVMRQAHRLGMPSTATMMFGHVETAAERIEHLEAIRRLQDESLARRRQDGVGGFFTAFTCWPFQPGNTRLGRRGVELSGAFAVEQLRMTALGRLYLDNVANIQASWVTQGPEVGQLSLLAGCNDMGSLMMEENVVAAAGVSFSVQLEQLRQLIRQAGFQPAQRNYYYDVASNG